MAKQKPKIGVLFNDQGGHLSSALDLEKLVSTATKNKLVVAVDATDKVSPDALAGWTGKAVSEHDMDRVLVIGKLTELQKKKYEQAFVDSGLNRYMIEWFDPQDQGLLDENKDQSIRDKKALVMLKMVLSRTKGLEPLEPEELPANERALIIGGGVSGLHAASSLVKLGKPVTLVEKNSGLGGKVAQLARFYPRMCDPHCGLEHILATVSDSDLLDIRTLTKVEKLDGGPGRFEVVLRQMPRYVNQDCDGCGLCQTVCPIELNDLVPPIECKLPPEAFKSLEQDSDQVEPQDAGKSDEQPEGEHQPDADHFSYELPLSDKQPFYKRKAIHPAMPMSNPVCYVIEREHCPPDCRECEKICPKNAVELEQKEQVESINAGAVLITTGWDKYALEKLQEYGYGQHPGVIDNLEMEMLLTPEVPSQERLQGVSLENLSAVGFIQCAGSRDERHLPYCSSVCCSVTMKQIKELKRINPDIDCYVYYMHIRTPGFEENMYREVRESGTVFIKDRPAKVDYDQASDKLIVESHDQTLDRKLHTELDLLVLAGGMRPSDGSMEVGKILKLPVNEYDFFKSHKQCYPAESQRTGVYVGGCAREPMNVAQSIDSSGKAALEALRFLSGSYLVDPTYPTFDEKKCDQCGRCVEECPFAVLAYNEKEIPVPDLAKCRQCGNCMGICPKTAVNLKHRNIKQYASQVEVLGENTSFLPKEEPVILAFLCENDAWLAAKQAQSRGLIPSNVVALKVPCAGALNNALIADALSLGVDGVYVGACPDGTCHYVKGNQLIKKRFEDLADKLKNMSMDTERVTIAGIGPRDVDEYVRSIEKCIADLKEKGPNPFKI